MRYLLMVLMFVAQSALAEVTENAADCVELGVKKDSQSIKNRCSQDVFIFWCHGSSSKPGTKSTMCGNTSMGKYFTQGVTFRPGETRDNSLNMPTDAQLFYGACFGRNDSVKILDDKGGYACKLVTSANELPGVIQVVGYTESEACERALTEGKRSNVKMGACTCVSKGKAQICHVPIIGQKREITMVGKLKIMLHKDLLPETVSNDPDSYLYTQTHTASTGVRN